VTISDKKASSISRAPRNIPDHGCCSRWVPRSLTIEHKTDRKPFLPSCCIVLKLGEAFLSRIVTADDTWHTRAYFSMAQGCRSGRRLGDKPSQFNMCYFHNFLINIYYGKIGHYFLGDPRSTYFILKIRYISSHLMFCFHILEYNFIHTEFYKLM
jgi:hypothetical protein